MTKAITLGGNLRANSLELMCWWPFLAFLHTRLIWLLM
jgi:hypothetical protein